MRQFTRERSDWFKPERARGLALESVWRDSGSGGSTKTALRGQEPHQPGIGRNAKRAGADISFHSLRHTAVSLLKDAGIPDAVVMALVGHDTVAMSQQYTHVGKEALENAANKMPDLTPRKQNQPELAKDAQGGGGSPPGFSTLRVKEQAIDAAVALRTEELQAIPKAVTSGRRGYLASEPDNAKGEADFVAPVFRAGWVFEVLGIMIAGMPESPMPPNGRDSTKQ